MLTEKTSRASNSLLSSERLPFAQLFPLYFFVFYHKPSGIDT